jgi:putative ABC transport system permease protein
VRLVAGHRTHRGAIMGIPQDPQLYRVIDQDMRAVHLPPRGLVMTDLLADLLALRPGDQVRVEVMEGDRRTLMLPLARTVREYSGTNTYMDLEALHAALGEDATLSGAFVSVDPAHMPALHAQLKQTPRVASVQERAAAVQSFRETTVESQRQMQFFNVIFACIIASGVVYNTARISLSERSRELATLRVIGFTRGEISSILLGELAVLTLAALPVGMALGYVFSWGVAQAFESESYRIPLVISHQTYGFAALVVLLAAAVSGLLVRRRLDRLDLVSVLKSKE